MSFTVREAIQETESEYRIQMIAGAKGDHRNISWVHMIEDTTIISNFWGNELAVTLGLNIRNDQELIKIIDLLIEHRACGLIVNVGKYIGEISPKIMDYCEERNFPLMTVPWEVYVADMVKDYCMRILLSEQDERMFARAFQAAIQDPANTEGYRKTLKKNFDLDGSFQVAVFYMNASEKRDVIYTRKAEARIRVILEKIKTNYSFFENDSYFVLIMNNVSTERMSETVDMLVREYEVQTDDYSIAVGIGLPAQGIINIAQSYTWARAAMRKAFYSNQKKVKYEDMGVDKLIFAVDDEQILFTYYQDTLKTLLEYDKRHHANYTETLEQYIVYNGSINAISQAMYTHRNTVN